MNLPIIGVNLNGKRSQDSDRCPPVIRDELVVYIDFKAAILQHALEFEITVWTHPPNGQKRSEPDLHGLARQILALTKLNWASSDALVGEPITTKYAGDIAYLTAAFMRQGRTFKLHPALERTPWFL